MAEQGGQLPCQLGVVGLVVNDQGFDWRSVRYSFTEGGCGLQRRRDTINNYCKKQDRGG